MFQGMEYVYEVYKQGSFQKAAEKLFISQPSVSASVRRAEERAGCCLFDRSVKPLALTECGRQYIDAVERILAIEREFSEYINDRDGLKRGKLVLGGSSLFSSLVLPPLMGEFRKRYPQVTLELVEDTTANLEEMLLKGSIDIMLDYESEGEKLFDSEVLEEDRIILSVPKSFVDGKAGRLSKYMLDHSEIANVGASGVSAVPLKEFKNMPFVLLKPANNSRRRAEQICAKQKFEPQVIMEFDQQMTAYLASCSGIGISFTGSMLISRAAPNPDVCYFKLDSSLSKRDVCVFKKHGRYTTKAMEVFIDIALERKV
ncbi:MAG: LysR family transcriptional regulator [Clostridia bacterium]|nr:LysR family transcriptional regulator [Clostridia bacterium]